MGEGAGGDGRISDPGGGLALMGDGVDSGGV